MKKTIFILLYLPFILLAQKKNYEVANFVIDIPSKNAADKNCNSYNSFMTTPFNMFTKAELLLLNRMDFKNDDIKEWNQILKDEMAQKYLKLTNDGSRTGNYNETTKQYESCLKFKVNTSDINVRLLFTNITEMQENDTVAVFHYTARLTVFKNENLKIIDTSITLPIEQRIVTKVILLFDPSLRLKLQMYKKNPVKQKELIEDFIRKFRISILEKTLESGSKVIDYYFNDKVEAISCFISGAKGSFDYTELNTTSQTVAHQLNKLTAFSAKNRTTLESMNNTLTPAVSLWKKELDQIDTTNSNARINTDIGDGLRYNLALAYVILKDYTSAYKYVNEIVELRPKKFNLVQAGTFKERATHLKALIERNKNNFDRFKVRAY